MMKTNILPRPAAEVFKAKCWGSMKELGVNVDSSSQSAADQPTATLGTVSILCYRCVGTSASATELVVRVALVVVLPAVAASLLRESTIRDQRETV